MVCNRYYYGMLQDEVAGRAWKYNNDGKSGGARAESILSEWVCPTVLSGRCSHHASPVSRSAFRSEKK